MFCEACGTRIAREHQRAESEADRQPDQLFCPTCGVEVPASVGFCRACGAPQPDLGMGRAERAASTPLPPQPAPAPGPSPATPVAGGAPPASTGSRTATRLVVGGIVSAIVGWAGLALAGQYEPTFENALFSGGEVLDQDTHTVLKTLSGLLVTLGIVGFLVGIVISMLPRASGPPLSAHAQSASEQVPGPGWYRDPTDQSAPLRWWDGSRWVDRTERIPR